MLEEAEDPKTLRVEVQARTGDVNGVSLTTVVTVPDWEANKSKARAQIKTVVDLLLATLPVHTVRGLDAGEDGMLEATLSKEGKLEFVPKQLFDAGRLQDKIRNKLERGEASDADKPTGV